MPLPKPAPPPYDVRAWQKKPPAERLRMVCQAWALQGYGTPGAIYLVYLLKVALYVGGWCFWCSFTPGLGDPRSLGAWWAAPEAFQKAVLWSLAFEGLGLGCGSGPLTGRYFPPVGGALYFVRPGTTKMPLFPGLPLLGGDRRTILDVGLYLAHYAFLVRARAAPALTPAIFVPTLILLPLLGLTDKTLFLAARAEHYGSALVCSLFAADWIAGSKVVWVAVWLWAATSKLNRHFPGVVAVMQSNSPLTGWGSLRARLFRRYPHDLRPSHQASEGSPNAPHEELDASESSNKYDPPGREDAGRRSSCGMTPGSRSASCPRAEPAPLGRASVAVASIIHSDHPARSRNRLLVTIDTIDTASAPGDAATAMLIALAMPAFLLLCVYLALRPRGTPALPPAQRHPIKTFPEGTVGRIVGVIEAYEGRSVRAPLSGQTGIAYSVRVVQHREDNKWEEIASDDDAVNFVVADETGRALVRAGGGWASPVMRHVDRTSPALKAFLAARGQSSDGGLLRAMEGVLAVGMKVGVVGIGRRSEEALDGASGGSDGEEPHALVIECLANGNLVISDSENALR